MRSTHSVKLSKMTWVWTVSIVRPSKLHAAILSRKMSLILSDRFPMRYVIALSLNLYQTGGGSQTIREA
jgi:hypothetical protein